MWTIISDVVGILGFLLSLTLAIQKLWERHLKLSLSKMNIGYLSREKPLCFIFATLTNTSAIPVSLLSFDIVTPGVTAKNSERIFTYDHSDEHISFDHVIINTPLPCHLSPHETKEICIAVENQQIKETLLRPELLRGPNEPQKRCHTFRRKLNHAYQILSRLVKRPIVRPIELVVYTPIGQKRFPLVFDNVADRSEIALLAFRKGLLRDRGDSLQK